MGEEVLYMTASEKILFIEKEINVSYHLPGILVSFSASLFCPEPTGELDNVGERAVGDFGVAEPTIKNIQDTFAQVIYEQIQ
ncbi:unnamed protein product, partial [Rotaria magnacalcarata]